MFILSNILDTAKRPLLIYGAGIHIAGAEALALKYAKNLGIPVVCTWGAVDLFCWDDTLYCGGFGTHGVRYANFAVQNADVILTIGTRLDTKATGSPAKNFAPKARVFMVEIDEAEILKFGKLGREVIGIHEDLRLFMKRTMPAIPEPIRLDWLSKIGAWRLKYPPGGEGKGFDPYAFVRELSGLMRPDDVIVSDTGCALGWMAQAFNFTGQRLIHAWNNTPMGYGLPAAIGAAFATGGRVVLITGDGGLSVNITELATLARHQLPVKVVLFNNRGHAMCRQTQRTWLGGTYPSTSYDGGLATPDFDRVASAYGIPIYGDAAAMLKDEGPGFLSLEVPEDCQIVPQVRFGRNLEDADPLLPREELQEIMA